MADMDLSHTARKRLVEIVATRGGVQNVLGRQSLIERSGLDALLPQINLGDMTADSFAWELVRALQDYGTLGTTGQPALVSLVRELRVMVRGHEDDAAFLDRLLAPYDDGATPTGPPAALPSASVGRGAPAQMTVLFLAANPRQTTALRLGEEARTIEERLREAALAERFDFRQQHAVRWSDVSLRLLRHAPHVVHFSGHGEFGGELVMEQADGSAFVVPTAVLADLFATLRDNIRCVILNACWSEGQARAMVAHIDFVIGMTRPVPDDAAIRFAAGFYRGIGFERSVRTAFQLGRNEMAASDPGLGDVPALLVRDGASAEATVLIRPRAADGRS